MVSQQRPVRIAGCSGSASDRRHAMHSLASNYLQDPVDVIVGDWMSEANMTNRAFMRTSSEANTAFEPSFLESLAPSLKDIAKHGIKVVTNAGASDTKKLYLAVKSMVEKQGLALKVAWISGDEVLPQILNAEVNGSSTFQNLYTGESLSAWKHKPIYAQAYLGGMGIAAALKSGADIVVCGRVSDASPCIGAAVWWHGWQRSQLDNLANAFVAGHMIECSTYVSGGNFTGFKDLEGKGWDDMGYPIAEISHDGQVIITKQLSSGGEISIDTCLSQLLYEIQGPWYFNSDVTAVLDNLHFEHVGTDRVALKGVHGDLPPPTTKVGIVANGGFQAEVHYFFVGLDIPEKARMMEAQLRKLFRGHNFSLLEFQTYGTAASNPRTQASATVDFRIFAQAPKAEDLIPNKFLRPCLDTMMQGYPGATAHLDFRQGFPKQIFEYYVTLMSQADVKHSVHLHTGENLSIPPPTETKVYPRQQPSYAETDNAVNLAQFGDTKMAPIGLIVHARSGDKGSDANCGFWVRHDDEYEWLRTLLSVETMKQLLADEYNGKKIVKNPLSFIPHNIY
jgi:hypothetical protein